MRQVRNHNGRIVLASKLMSFSPATVGYGFYLTIFSFISGVGAKLKYKILQEQPLSGPGISGGLGAVDVGACGESIK